VTDWAAEGLLDGLQDEESRQARSELLDRLAGEGVPLDELRRAVEEDRLAFLPLERSISPDGRSYSAKQIAEQAGLDYHLLTELWRSLGMAASEPDEPVYSEDDLEAARTARAALEAGVPRDAVLEILRVAGHGMSQLAAAIRGTVGDALIEPGMNERDAALRWVELERATRPQLEAMLAYALRVHQRGQMRNDVVRFAELSSGRLAEGRDMTVAFADLVGFTRLGESAPAEQLGALADRLSTMARDAATGPVRLVKTIGDAAMLVSPETDPLLDAALTLVEEAREEGDDFPQLRVGVAQGPALSRAGDWYGRPVNLASRITDIARRGSILVSKEAKQNAAGDYDWSEAGHFRIKGVKGRVPLYRLRRAT
jgi:adenylate cyclase